MAKTNEAYWKERALALEAAQHDNAGAFAAEWQGEYDKAAARIQRDTEAWYQRVADNNEVSLADAKRLIGTRELKELRWSLEDFTQKAKENGDLRWEKELVNASARQHISWLEREKIMLDQEVNAVFSGKREKAASLLGGAYSTARDRTAFDIQRGTGAGKHLRTIDAASIEKVLNKPWAPDGKTFSDRIWGNQEKLKAELQTKLVQGLIRGENPHELAEALSERMGVSRDNAARLVYTESAYFSELGILEGYREHGIDQLEILATLDSTTCTDCGSLDGKVIDLKDARIGATVPVFHPRCRCTTIPHYDDMEDVGQRIARGEDGTQYYVPANMTYGEWRKSFVKTSPETRFADVLKTGGVADGTYKTALEQRFNAGTDDAKKAFEKYVPGDSVAEGDLNPKISPHYSHRDKRIHMNYARDAVDKKGAGTTYFHEHGHLIDYIGQTPLHREQKFVKALHSDFTSYIIEAKKRFPGLSKKELYESLGDDVLQKNVGYHDAYSSVSDLLEGLSTDGGKSKYSIVDGWRHGRQYWKQRPEGVESEAFAHFYEAQFDPIRRAALQQFFPQASVEFERILKGAV